MVKPQLPPVPDAIARRVYKPSGKYAPGSFARMLVLGFLVAIVIGIIAQYIGQWIIPWGKSIVAWVYDSLVLSRFCCFIPGFLVAYPLQLALIIVFGLLFLLYPFILGGVIGAVMRELIRWGKCRSARLSVALGLVNGVGAYISLALLRSHLLGHADTSSGLVAFLKLPSTPWWAYVLIGLDALIVAAVSVVISKTYVMDHPFCETCGEWYAAAVPLGVFPLAIAEPLVQTLESGELQAALKEIPPTKQPPSITIAFARCPSCATADIGLETHVNWEEVSKGSQGKEKTHSLTKPWFSVMVPGQLFAQIEEALSKSYEASLLKPAVELPPEEGNAQQREEEKHDKRVWKDGQFVPAPPGTEAEDDSASRNED